MFAAVKGKWRIIVLDRSVLAGNLYKLLFAELDSAIFVRRRFEEARPTLAGRERIDLAIFNSNAFGKKSGEIVDAIEAEPELMALKKVFILKEGDSEAKLSERLKGLKGAHVVTRPFHPDEFLQTVKRILGEAG